MLVLTRKKGQSIVIGEGIEVTIVDVSFDSVRIGIKANKNIPIYRREIYDLILKETGGVWKSVREIWQNMGKDEFQLLEEDASRNFVEWIIPDLDGEGCILSLGGGTVENTGAMAWIGKKGTNVYIQGDEEMLFQRIMANGHPPFLSEEQPREDFSALYRRRDALYRSFAHLIHPVDDSPADLNARRLVVALENYDER